MRLINARTLEMQNFITGKVPPYVVLSHRWEGEESTLQDFTAFLRMSDEDKTALVASLEESRGGPGEAREPTTGILKVLEFCDAVREEGYEWGWIDTVCIDKTNNAELSEAINSMFRWYRESSICFVFLTDVRASGDISDKNKLKSSAWFTRGWTLQELIAPAEMTFYDSSWKDLGSRRDLNIYISDLTGIPRYVLRRPEIALSYSSAARMSWAAKREVTREEDMAYCLLGLFDVNMELLYGEGAQKAFRRLQMKILEEFDDETLFMWAMTDVESAARAHVLIVDREADPTGSSPLYSGECALTGALAQAPRQFTHANRMEGSTDFLPSGPVEMTSWGIKFKRPVFDLAQLDVRVRTVEKNMFDENDEYGDTAMVAMLVPLTCSEISTKRGGFVFVVSDKTAKHGSILCRVNFPRVEPSKGQTLDRLLRHIERMKVTESDATFFLRISWPSTRMSWHTANNEELIKTAVGSELRRVSGASKRPLGSMRTPVFGSTRGR